MNFANLENHVALVTGASGGLGRVIANELARGGASVAVHYFNNQDGALETARGLKSNQKPHHLFQADLAGDDIDEVAQKLIEDVKAKFGDITILVNNAADQVLSSIINMESISWSHMQNSILRSAIALTRAAMREMLPGSSVINISSVEAVKPFLNHSHYAAAKAALESFTLASALRFLASESASGITGTVLTVDAGWLNG